MRALVSAAIIGSLAGLAVGTAYMGGSLAKSISVRAKAERLAGAADASEQALIAAAGGLDQSALSVARRHDPYTVAGGAARDRQATAFAARLERQEAVRAGLRRVNVSTNQPAQPFRVAGALDASRDLDCLAQAVYYEARGEGAAGMRAVAQVVLNRVRHPAFPKTVCGVVYQGAAKRTGCQFSFTCNGSMRRGKEPGAWRRARDIAAKAMGGQVMAEVGNATHFHTTGVSPGWRHSLLRVSQVGTHVFYRFGGRRSGGGGAFQYTPQPAGERESYQPVYASIVPTPAPGAEAPYKVLFTGLTGGEAEAAAKPAAAKPAAAEAVKPATAAVKPAETAPKPEEAKPAAPAPAPAQVSADSPAS